MGVRFTPDQLKATNNRKGAKETPLVPHAAGNLFPAVRPAFLIGLDPGIATGFAIWQPRTPTTPGRFIEVVTYTFVQTVRRLETLCRQFGPAKLRVRIENPAGNRPTFDKGQGAAKIREKISQNVGSNKRDAQLLCNFLDELGIPYDLITPQKGRNQATGKVTAEYFKGVPGFPAKSSQHARDGAALVMSL